MKVLDQMNQSIENISAKVQNKLNQLPPRDRFALIILSIFLVVTSIGALMWFTHQAALKQEQRVTELKDTITWMQSNVVQFSNQSAELSSTTDKINRLAQQLGISVQMQEQQGQVQFVVSHQNYAVLANFLTQLGQQGVSIISMDMQKQTDASIRLTAVVQ